MKNSFLSIGYVAMVLIKEKTQIFGESFITMSELNQFRYFMQKEFNNKNLGIAIVSNDLSIEDFNIFGGVVIPSERCCYNVDYIRSDVLNILTDENLILQFFTELENRKLKILENIQANTYNSSTKDKKLSLELKK